MGSGNEKGQRGFGYRYKIMMKVEIYKQRFISKKLNQIFYFDQADRLH